LVLLSSWTSTHTRHGPNRTGRGGRTAASSSTSYGTTSRPDSLLVSTEDLAQPPDWVNSAVSTDLGSESIVFVGLGTVGDYVATRIRQLLEFGRPGLRDIAVVSHNGVLSEDVPFAVELRDGDPVSEIISGG
jgi:hypothetical protein